MKDNSGRAYATVEGTKVGDVLEADGDFTCMRAGQKVVVRMEDGDLVVPCRHGSHGLAGQLTTEDGVGFYMGLYPAS